MRSSSAFEETRRLSGVVRHHGVADEVRNSSALRRTTSCRAKELARKPCTGDPLPEMAYVALWVDVAVKFAPSSGSIDDLDAAELDQPVTTAAHRAVVSGIPRTISRSIASPQTRAQTVQPLEPAKSGPPSPPFLAVGPRLEPFSDSTILSTLRIASQQSCRPVSIMNRRAHRLPRCRSWRARICSALERLPGRARTRSRCVGPGPDHHHERRRPMACPEEERDFQHRPCWLRAPPRPWELALAPCDQRVD